MTEQRAVRFRFFLFLQVALHRLQRVTHHKTTQLPRRTRRQAQKKRPRHLAGASEMLSKTSQAQLARRRFRLWFIFLAFFRNQQEIL